MKHIFYLTATLFMFTACGTKSSETSNDTTTTETSVAQQPALSADEYEIIGTNHNTAVKNFYVLVKKPGFNQASLTELIKKFKAEHCSGDCNVMLYDSKEISHLLTKYPLENDEYILMADHFIADGLFGSDYVSWYPYQDFKYRDLGGKNWKKEPIKKKS
ncbi:MAG TPA: hypothetical protein PLW44_04300 [Chitinophagales bacterium]|nr:hypothetical protein [Chitinophagales bacterium]